MCLPFGIFHAVALYHLDYLRGDSVAEQRTEIQLMERELASLHRRFDLSNMPSQARETQEIQKSNG